MIQCETKRYVVSNVSWTVPEYGSNQIKRAGEIIVSGNQDSDECRSAMAVVDNWRLAHAYPLNVFYMYLKRHYKQYIVAQRLKRLASIVGKLQRFPTMDLWRMQDLGGCRVIVDSIEQVEEVVCDLKNAGFHHQFVGENNYIANPKSSGYRSYHLKYKYHSDRQDTYNNNMRIEIQVRTKLQHIWATAVEMMDMISGSSLKSGEQSEVSEFFRICSALFSKIEGTAPVPDTPTDRTEIINRIRELDAKLNILNRLDTGSFAVKISGLANPDSGNYIVLHFTGQIVNMFTYKPSLYDKAFEKYRKLEGQDGNAVMVKVGQFAKLRAAYPNYFMDTHNFLELIRSQVN